MKKQIRQLCFCIITISVISLLIIINKFNILENLLDKTWFSKPSTSVVENSEDYFTNEELTNIKVSLNSQNLYYYEQLNDKEKEIFNYIYISIKNRKEAIYFKNPIELNLLTNIVYIIKFDCPEFYFLGNSFDYDIKSKKVTTYYPEYILSEKQYSKMQKEIDQIILEIRDLTANQTEYDAEIIIHNYIAKECEYVIDSQNCNNLYGCLIEKKANCEGYSAAFSYLLRQIGIESTQVIGEVPYEDEMVGHSWNLVKIDGDYYYVDVCWDDLANIPEYNNIDYHFAFFNITYDEITELRNIEKNLTYLGDLPKSTSTTLNYYKKSELYITSLENAEKIIKEKLPITISTNEKFFVLKCNSKETYNELLENITNIMQETINEYKLAITKCKYAKIDNGYTLIIHNFSYKK